MKDNQTHTAPFSLFQSADGRWGTKDANGNIHDEAVYKRMVLEDGSVRYGDGYSTVCEFSEEEGMELLCWCEPWWESAFQVAHYPEEYDGYIFKHIKSETEPDENTQILQQLNKIVELSEIQKTVIEEVDFYFREVDTLELEDEEEWYANESSKLTPEERVEAISPLMMNSSIPEDMKSLLWYALFRFNDWYDGIEKSS